MLRFQYHMVNIDTLFPVKPATQQTSKHHHILGRASIFGCLCCRNHDLKIADIHLVEGRMVI